jgi:AraC family transcriptional regulator
MDPVRKAVWFVESHLGDNALSLEHIARQCNVSPFHLTRAFTAATGVSLMRYVRGRRLSMAAEQLAAGATDILLVALDAGYGSHEAFTRAFREQFGMTPEQARASGIHTDLPLVEAISMTATSDITLDPPRFETRGPRLLVGLVQRHDCQAPEGIPRQWQRLGQYLERGISGQVASIAYGVCYNFDSDGAFDYLCGVEIGGSRDVPPGLVTLQLAPQRYAVFSHSGHIIGIRSAIDAAWNRWLPASGEQAVEAPFLEVYGPQFNPSTGLGGFEIWLPIADQGLH